MEYIIHKYGHKTEVDFRGKEEYEIINLGEQSFPFGLLQIGNKLILPDYYGIKFEIFDIDIFALSKQVVISVYTVFK